MDHYCKLELINFAKEDQNVRLLKYGRQTQNDDINGPREINTESFTYSLFRADIYTRLIIHVPKTL